MTSTSPEPPIPQGSSITLAVAAGNRDPRLVADPPPYRLSPLLRGPKHLEADIDGVLAADRPGAVQRT